MSGIAGALVIELRVLLWIFLGWEFVLALYLGAAILIPVMVVLVRLTCPKRLGEEARRRKGGAGEAMDPAEGSRTRSCLLTPRAADGGPNRD